MSLVEFPKSDTVYSALRETRVSTHLLPTVTVTTPFADEWPRLCQVSAILARARDMPLWYVGEEATFSYQLLFSYRYLQQFHMLYKVVH